MLNFVQPPSKPAVRRIGNAASGVIEMEVRGGLSVDESDMVADILAEQDSTLVVAAKLADAIATEENITINEAYRIVEDSVRGKELEPDANAIRLRHIDEIARIIEIFRQSSTQSNRALVTALIRFRGGKPDWPHTSTGTLPKALFNGILELGMDEQDAEDMQPEPPSEDDLKKPQPDPPQPQKRTGPKSSGN